MAIYHLSMKTISRSAGRSATAAAAYRAGVEIEDQRTGEVHDYTRKRGVVSTQIHAPEDAPAWADDRAELWNQAESKERRKNSTVAREIIVALPDELSAEDRSELTASFAKEIVKRHGCAVDVAIHTPGKEGDNRNHHAHLLMSTRRLEPEGFTAKTRELDDRKKGKVEVSHWRERWADLTNKALERAGRDERIDHRSLKDQGIEDRAPTEHRGPRVTGIERRGERTGETSERGQELDARHADKSAQIELKGIQTEQRQTDGEQRNAVANLARLQAAMERQREAQAKARTEADTRAQAQRSVSQSPETRAQRQEREIIERIEAQGGEGYTAAHATMVNGVGKVLAKQRKQQWTENGKALSEQRRQWRDQEPKIPKIFGRKKAEAAHEAWAAEGQRLNEADRLHMNAGGTELKRKASQQARETIKRAYPELSRRAEAETERRAAERAREYQEKRERERERERERGRSR